MAEAEVKGRIESVRVEVESAGINANRIVSVKAASIACQMTCG